MISDRLARAGNVSPDLDVVIVNRRVDMDAFDNLPPQVRAMLRDAPHAYCAKDLLDWIEEDRVEPRHLVAFLTATFNSVYRAADRRLPAS